jgi:nitrite reductase/ring-hydroxylating ferredoxin subunit
MDHNFFRYRVSEKYIASVSKAMLLRIILLLAPSLAFVLPRATQSIVTSQDILYATCAKAWVPLCRTKDVQSYASKPHAVSFLNETVSVVKTDGDYYAFDSICPHRGGLLHYGTYKKGVVTCPYHSFDFDCTDGTLQKRKEGMNLKIYPTRVHDDLVWIALGGFQSNANWTASDLKVTEDGDDADFREVTGVQDMKTDVFSLIDNLLCVLHVGEVHRFGNNVNPEPTKVVHVPDRNGNYFSYIAGAQSYAKASSGSARQLEVEVFNAFAVPFGAMTRVKFGNSTKSVRLHLLPLAPHKTRMFWSLSRNFMTSPLLDPLVRFIMQTTIDEDQDILSKTALSNVPRKQSLTRFDWLTVLYRKRMHALLRQYGE